VSKRPRLSANLRVSADRDALNKRSGPAAPEATLAAIEVAPEPAIPGAEPVVGEPAGAQVSVKAMPAPLEAPAASDPPIGVPMEPLSLPAAPAVAVERASPVAAATCGESLGSIVNDATAAMSLTSCAWLTHALVLQLRLSAYMLDAMLTGFAATTLKLRTHR
jgi:hypothetical protein